MKNLVLIFLLTFSTAASAQFYSEFEMPNTAKTKCHVLTVPPNEAWNLLINNNVQPPKVYYLSNMPDSIYIPPTTLAPGWSLNTVFKPNLQTYYMDVGDNFIVVNDPNGNSYNAFH